jgi:hypothetical protein
MRKARKIGGKVKAKDTKGKVKEEEGRGKGSLSSSVTPSPTSSKDVSLLNMPFVFEDECERVFVMCSHFRSYLYPVSTPIFWFNSQDSWNYFAS